MWEITLADQLFGVFVSFVFGALLAFLYDIPKAYCLKYKPSKLFIFVKDMIFSSVAAVLNFLLLMVLSNGAVRGYLLFCEVLGFIVFRLVLSKYWLVAVTFVISFFVGVNNTAEELLRKLSDIIGVFENYIVKKFKKICKKALKLRKNS